MSQKPETLRIGEILVEQKVLTEQQVFEVLDSEIHADSEPAENEMRYAMEVRVARNGQGDFVSHRARPSTLRRDPARGAPPRPFPR